MSRFIKSNPHPENAYVEFRFEHSLRKYEQKPIKKIKCNPVCRQCVDHHLQKNHSFSSIAPRQLNPSKQNSLLLGSSERLL